MTRVKMESPCGGPYYNGQCQSTTFDITATGHAYCSGCGKKVNIVKKIEVKTVSILHDWIDGGNKVGPVYCSVCNTLWDHTVDKEVCFVQIKEGEYDNQKL